MPFEDLIYNFTQLNEGLEANRATLGDERYLKLMQLSDQMRALFEADPNDKTGETTLGCKIIHQMLFMVIERFRDNDMVPVYQRVRDQGRTLPMGLEYVDSWIEPNFAWLFQLMRCDDLKLLQEWVLQWRGYGVTFEIVPVVPSRETQTVVAPHLTPSDKQRD